ncbi:MAG: hypothetical protein LBJ64_11045 [Deltaproteobacteria bacterium]|jgi:hypothetical protein|nr:hypothetical protein [Deltaproteobacteria bacterium]
MFDPVVSSTKKTSSDDVKRSAADSLAKNGNGESERLLKLELQIASLSDDFRELKRSVSDNIRTIDDKIDDKIKNNMNIKLDSVISKLGDMETKAKTSLYSINSDFDGIKFKIDAKHDINTIYIWFILSLLFVILFALYKMK